MGIRIRTQILTLFFSAAFMGAAFAANAPEETYNKYCSICHKQGLAGAPKLDDKAAWSERLAKGKEELLKNLISGTSKGLPPKGMCMECSDDELMATIEYMLKAAGL